MKNIFRKRRSRRADAGRLLAASVALALLAAGLWLALGWRGNYLLLSNQQSGQILLRVPAEDGVEFSVSYTHSVNKSPVEEYYQIRGSDIYLTALRFKTFGAGMPQGPEEGQVMRYEDGGMVIEGFERSMPYLCYFIGRVAGHTLHWQGREILLDTLDAPGQPVQFSVVEYPHILERFGMAPKAGG